MRPFLLVSLSLALAGSACVHVTTCNCTARSTHDDEVFEARDEAVDETAPMLTGVVVDGRGRPVADTPVRVYGGLATRWQTGETCTDDDGRFSFAEVSGAMTKPDADGPWHQYVGVCAGRTVGSLNPAAYLPWTDVTIAPGGTEHVTLVLDPAEVERRIAAERAR
ncbi:MAG: hypothetical protein ACE37K_22750 [Planctomycetota bacterium]